MARKMAEESPSIRTEISIKATLKITNITAKEDKYSKTEA